MLRRSLRIAAVVIGIGSVTAVIGLVVTTRRHALDLLTSPAATRPLPSRTPADEGLDYEDVVVRTRDGVWLVGWYTASRNRAAVLLQHGYKADRGEMLNEAAMLAKNGFGVLVSSIRAHDRSEGERISFGVHEMNDLSAWTDWLAAQPDVDRDRIGVLGNSLGGSLVIQAAAGDERIRAVVANSAFSSLEDTIETSIRFFTGLPPFPFVPMIVFWAERESGFDVRDIDTKRWIGRLSPRPVLLMQGGTDSVISPSSGQRLFDAAGEPKELWFDPELRHTRFDTARAEEFERRVVTFFSRYLIGPEQKAFATSPVR